MLNRWNEGSHKVKRTDQVTFENKEFKLRKIWTDDWIWHGDNYDREIICVRYIHNGASKHKLLSLDGNPISNLCFDYVEGYDDEIEGISPVKIDKGIYGFIDEEKNIVVLDEYDYIHDFVDGRAWVEKDGLWSLIDSKGREIPVENANRKYAVKMEFSNGMCAVSTIDLEFNFLRYYTDYKAGLWGFIDEEGKEIIKPQFIYVQPFENDQAIVAKGEWVKDSNGDSDQDKVLYRAENEKWGGIDKEGNEVIPFKFDEIYELLDIDGNPTGNYIAWYKGKCGVIDNRGDWLMDPVCNQIDLISHNGLVAFSFESYIESYPHVCILGVYNCHTHKVVLDPQFASVEFLESGDIEVSNYDEISNSWECKIFDMDGREKIRLDCDSLFEIDDYFEIRRLVDNEKINGIIDKNGKVIVPCIYNIPFFGIDTKGKKFIFVENGKAGVKDFAEKIIIPAIYDDIRFRNEFCMQIGMREEDGYYRYGLITHSGEEILPPIYRNITFCEDERHIMCSGEEFEMYVIESC